jgi:hypothetical protein
MDDLFLKFWPYVERAGAFGALVFSWLFWDARKELRDARSKIEDLQEKRIEDAKTVLPIIKENTAATRQLGELLHETLRSPRKGPRE